ncbi:MAG: shikimate kinase [Candidatus Binatia bacterium]
MRREKEQSAHCLTSHCLTGNKNIALIGFMAVGKSVVGQRLARRLKRPFVDLDRAIETKEGMKVAEIFARRGEAYFRRVERETAQEILGRDRQVIAAGGGAVVDEENLSLFKQRSLLICLTAPPEILLRRVGRRNERPLLEGKDKKKRIEELLKQREKSYAQAHVSIDTSSLSVDEVVEKIIKAIHRLTAPSPVPSPSGRGRG